MNKQYVVNIVHEDRPRCNCADVLSGAEILQKYDCLMGQQVQDTVKSGELSRFEVYAEKTKIVISPLQ